ncbi:glycosyltransferase WbuB [Methyloceanibacter superfactus]|jgi:glycosyltransferase involved in cell wall biosynthesis|uniref:Glycosyltransferase WbuB n=1 Tax=Methyloceanibacter superfactus TaxID=1774969 RepID=A0A1E3W5F2_9HYPH|nr:glycosyltransferase family 4 protein [Methyloceanibacter superfactus]ODS01014.1 glycosyltransferase WbuB [Methyloceanibacter superfactus]
MIVENLPVPFDRRVWSQARTLQRAGYDVSVICPKGKDAETSYEELEGIHVYRHPLPIEAKGVLAYPLEYVSALVFELWLTLRIFFTRGFDVIHACNPPDTIFLIAGLFKLLAGTRFVFDHHDINPELYEAKFGRRDMFWRLLLWLERMTFKTADVSIATNGSYRRIAIERGGMHPGNVFVVRSGPDLTRMKILPPRPELKHGRKHLVGYVGVIGQQEGIDLLLHAIRSIVADHGRHDIHFGIVGGGPALKDMEALAVRLDVADYVTFTGRVPDQAFLEMLNTADVCVNPDRVNAMNDKSTMNKIMEYMALAKPIVQFELAEGRVSAGEASLYAKANDPKDMAAKIVALIDDPAQRQAMGDYGRARVLDALSWEHEAPKLLAAYDAVFEAPEAYAAPKPRHAE